MNANKRMSRRQFVKIAGLTAGTAALAACAPIPQVPQETPVVQPTVAKKVGGGYPADFKARSPEWLNLPADHKPGTLVTQQEWYTLNG